MSRIIRKADIILAAVLIVICVAISYIVYGMGDSGSKVVISVDGKIFGEYSLIKDNVIEIDTELGHNEVTIKDGRVFMSDADCPDKYCIHQYRKSKGINSSNQTIVCLPHKVVISIDSDESFDEMDESDAVTGRVLYVGADSDQEG